MRKNETSLFTKRALLQFLVSVSLFSLILRYYSLFFFFQPLSFHVYIDTKYMFLICNGILVFLAKSPTSIPSSSSPTADHIKTSVDNQHAKVSSTDATTAAAYDDDDDFVVEDEEQHQEEEEAEEGERAEDLIKESLSAETKGMEVEEAPNEEEVLSRDELNKKIEEFIRKMKEGIRIEAQQQLVAV